MSEDIVSIIWQSILLFILIVFSSYFSAYEAAISSVTKFKLETFFNNNKKSFTYKKINFLIEHFQMSICSTIIGNNLVAVAASTLSTLLFTNICLRFSVPNAESLAAGLATGIVTFLLLFFGEFLPKTLARQYDILFLRKTILFALFLYFLFWPISWILTLLTPKKHKKNITEQDLHSFVKIVKQEGEIGSREATLVRNAIKFDDTRIINVMKPIKDIKAIDIKLSIQKISNVFIETKFSRLPVIKNNKFIGMITYKNFFEQWMINKNNFDLASIIRPIIKISQYQNLDDLLQEMQVNQCHMALIKKNNNSKEIIGFIALENILEYLVGKIYDEDDKKLKVAQINAFTYRVNEDVISKDFFNKYFHMYDFDNKSSMKTWFKEEFKIKRLSSNNYKKENDLFIISAIKDKKSKKYYFIIEKKTGINI